MMCRSVRHTPAPPILTIMSSGPAIVGSGTSSTTGPGGIRADGRPASLLLTNTDSCVAVVQHSTANPGVRRQARPCYPGRGKMQHRLSRPRSP